jgi:hypothetical protein
MTFFTASKPFFGDVMKWNGMEWSKTEMQLLATQASLTISFNSANDCLVVRFGQDRTGGGMGGMTALRQ